MKGKALLNVYTHQIKNDLLSILVQNNCDFVEVFEPDDLAFKYNLMKGKLGLYIHELDEENYTKSLENIKSITDTNIRCIILIHRYSSQIIEDALALKVKDIIVLPIEPSNLASKLKSYINEPKVTVSSESSRSHKITEQFDRKIVDDEMNRSKRGNYPLSIVLIEYAQKGTKGHEVFKQTLKKLLRTTDIVLEYSQGEWLILCPFTPKSYIVEVENKVRIAHKQSSKISGEQVTVYLYGVTFPDNGESFEMLEKELKDGIHDSIIFSNLEGTLSQMDKEVLQTKLKRNYSKKIRRW